MNWSKKSEKFDPFDFFRVVFVDAMAADIWLAAQSTSNVFLSFGPLMAMGFHFLNVQTSNFAVYLGSDMSCDATIMT